MRIRLWRNSLKKSSRIAGRPIAAAGYGSQAGGRIGAESGEKPAIFTFFSLKFKVDAIRVLALRKSEA
jgi:hypothetical protein